MLIYLRATLLIYFWLMADVRKITGSCNSLLPLFKLYYVDLVQVCSIIWLTLVVIKSPFVPSEHM